MQWAKKQIGFTIVELLIVVVVIAILASITVVAYNGIQNRTYNTKVMNTMQQVSKLIEAYNAQHGSYPTTGGLGNVYSDANCSRATDSDGYKGTDWVPGIMPSLTSSLPQSQDINSSGISGIGGCYFYASDGTNYILTAWNAKRGGPSTDALYRRLGFRELSFSGSNAYYCNHSGIIGGNTGSGYDIGRDYYKHSYTISSIKDCNETPPSGA